MNQQPNHIAAVVLAAGFSNRFGEENKLHTSLESGLSIIEQVLQRVAEFPFAHRIVVCQANDTAMKQLADRYGIELAVNENAAQGIGSSIATGIGSLDRTQFFGAAIFLGDMPFIDSETISMVVKEFTRQQSTQITRPSCSDQAGHPVIFPSHLFDELRELNGDTGANHLIRQHENLLSLVKTDDAGVLQDIDTASDLPT